MRMKNNLVGLVLGCALVLACIGCDAVTAREMFFISGRSSYKQVQNKQKIGSSSSSSSSSPSPIAVVEKGVLAQECRSKKLGFCDFYFSHLRKDKNNTLDEKRVVPTGPNPLHNR